MTHRKATSIVATSSAEIQEGTFTVMSDIGTLAFTGVHDGEQITGTYTVQHPAGGREAGSFKLSKESAIRAVLPREVTAHAETVVESTNMSPPEKALVGAEPPKVGNLQLGRLLDHDQPFMERNMVEKCLHQGRLT